MTRVGYIADAVLYADLRPRLDGPVELVDLTHEDRERVAAELPDLDLILHHPRYDFDASMFQASDRLRAVLAPGAGYDHIDIATATARGVLVTNQAGCNDEAVAEHAIGLMLGLLKRIVEGDRLVHRSTDWYPGALHNHELRGRTLGLVGYGAIGRRLATIARVGFGMPVIAHDPYVAESEEGVTLVDLDTLCSESDVVSIHAPLTETTRRMIGRPQFERMRETTIFINTARGHVVDQEALVEALNSGRIAGAGLDVVEDDALPLDHALLQLDNVIVTPHSAGATYESLEDQARRQAEAVLAMAAGQVPTTANVLNPEAIADFLARADTSGDSSPE